MFWFQVLTWVAFGAIAGLWQIWFRQNHTHWEVVAVGMAGGLLGGSFGLALAVALPAPVALRGYSFLAVACAVLTAASLVYVYNRVRRRRPAQVR